MLMGHPVLLRNLLDQYEALSSLNAAEGSPAARRRYADVVYNLCIATGTRELHAALAIARRRFPAPRADGHRSPDSGPPLTA
ncbi:DUF5133 domain-containing protein [Yinghuangia soli]|uniref:DUF5133 domain-containing protein n=1 Tax=Yinghuangia soli TaxID=2908204 RepID=A0AA41Q0L5_9ACTN|nr:DUF5133 domain-containing protein [Yinghuangia soli]MCF2528770.1 DUF5133 domain-containing protein [Yinghuangia soli]